MLGLWSATEAIHTKKFQKVPYLIEDPWGLRLLIFSNRIFRSDFVTKFVDIKTLFRDHTGATVSLFKLQNSFEC